MEISFIAFDSFGVKSSCIQLKTKDCCITIDPGIAFETNSFPLTLTEKAVLDLKYRRAIKKACKESDIIVITHYHYDHHIPEASLYKNKILLIKDPEKNINRSQKARALYFLSIVKNNVEIKITDSQTFKFGKTIIKFSKPLWHGVRGTKLGKVLMVTVEEKRKSRIRKVLYSSDIDGPYIREYADLIIKENPDILILDGHPTYLLGYLASFALLKKVLLNTIKILEKTNCKLYILDHHLLRDYRYKELYYEVYKRASQLGKRVMTAAEFLGKEPAVIAGYKKHGPTKWKNWQSLTFEQLNKIIAHAEKIKRKNKKKKK